MIFNINSTRGHTGSLLVVTISKPYVLASTTLESTTFPEQLSGNLSIHHYSLYFSPMYHAKFLYCNGRGVINDASCLWSSMVYCAYYITNEWRPILLPMHEVPCQSWKEGAVGTTVVQAFYG